LDLAVSRREGLVMLHRLRQEVEVMLLQQHRKVLMEEQRQQWM
jgi:hypothetical protein